MKNVIIKMVPTIAVLAIAGALCAWRSTSASSHPGYRSFEMGLSYWPQNGQDTPDALVGKSIGQTLSLSEHILVQLPWSPQQPNIGDAAGWMAGIARQQGRGLTIAMDWMEPSRDCLRGAAAHPWSFSESESKAAFGRAAIDCAARYKPDYLVLGVEVNYMAYSDPAGFREFVNTYANTYGRIKEVSPKTRVLVTFQYEVLMGLDREWTANAGLEPVHAFGSLLDCVGLSTYPFLAGPSNEQGMTADYFGPVKAMGRPWGIFETSHPTMTADPAERRAQKNYADTLLSAATRNGASILVWCGTTDTHLAPHAGPKSTASQDGRWMSNLGLCDVDGNPKMVVAPWRSAMSLRRVPLSAIGDIPPAAPQ